MKSTHLSERALVRIDGEDAVEFLQNLITCDVENLQEGEATFGALLTPQGKILFDFFCVRTGPGFLFDIATDTQADFIKRMTFYKLRTPVKISAAENDLKVYAVWNDNAPLDIDDINIEDGYAFIDPRLALMGNRIISTGFECNSDVSAYHSHRISHGMPDGGVDYAYGDTFPHDAMMDQFEDKGTGVAFQKGCYVGQEVVSRMQHRGTARRRIVLISADQSIPPTGTNIEANGKSIGMVRSSDDQNGLAMVRIDRLANALKSGIEISSDGIALQVSLPKWTNLSLGTNQSE